MSDFRVFIPNKIQGNAVDYLRKYVEVDYRDVEEKLSQAEFYEGLEKADGLLIPSRNKITRETLEHAPQLKAVCNIAVGFDNVDIDALTERGIFVTNTPGVLTETTADLAFSLILSTARRIPEADAFVKEGKWKGWMPSLMLGKDVNGATLGIIGYGRIGSAIARRARGFNMQIKYNDIHRILEDEEKLGIEYAELDDIFRKSDFVLVQVPLTPETKSMIGAKEFSMMKKDAFFINASRGQVVDEPALIQALQEKDIAGAGLDTYAEEPLPADHPFLKIRNVVTLPHIGSATLETREKMEDKAAYNMVQIATGKVPENLINKELAR